MFLTHFLPLVSLLLVHYPQSSLSLYDTSNIYEASQYGSIWYTRDLSSEIVGDDGNSTGASFSNETKEQCELLAPVLDYITPEECTNFQGIGYVVQYNFTGLHTGPLFQTLADQALARFAMDNNEITITTTIAPLPITPRENSFGEAEDAFTAWFLVSRSIVVVGLRMCWSIEKKNNLF